MSDEYAQKVSFCAYCRYEWTSYPDNYCPKCGKSVEANSSTNNFTSFRSRWLIIPCTIGIIGSTILDESFQIALAIWIAFVVGRSNISIRLLLGRFPVHYNWWPIVLLAIAGLIYSVGAATVLEYPVAKYLPEVHEIYQGVYLEARDESMLRFLILAVVLAPLLEEMAFRGLLFGRFTKKWGMTRGVLLSSLVFGILHFDLNPIGRFVMGIVACVLYVKTRTLIVPIVFHALNNFIVFVLILVWPSQPVQTPPESGEVAYLGLISMLIASPAVFMVMGSWWPRAGTKLPYDYNQVSTQSENQWPMLKSGQMGKLSKIFSRRKAERGRAD